MSDRCAGGGDEPPFTPTTIKRVSESMLAVALRVLADHKARGVRVERPDAAWYRLFERDPHLQWSSLGAGILYFDLDEGRGKVTAFRAVIQYVAARRFNKIVQPTYRVFLNVHPVTPAFFRRTQRPCPKPRKWEGYGRKGFFRPEHSPIRVLGRAMAQALRNTSANPCRLTPIPYWHWRLTHTCAVLNSETTQGLCRCCPPTSKAMTKPAPAPCCTSSTARWTIQPQPKPTSATSNAPDGSTRSSS